MQFFPYCDTIALSMMFKEKSKVLTSIFQMPDKTALDSAAVALDANRAKGVDNKLGHEVGNRIDLATSDWAVNGQPWISALFTLPQPNFVIPPTVSAPVVRWLHYTERGTIAAGAAASASFSFNQIRLEAHPRMYMVYCRPVKDAQDFTYSGNLYGISCENDYAPGAMSLTVNEASGVGISFTLRTLYDWYKRCATMGERRFRVKDYTEWKRSPVIAFTPSMLGEAGIKPSYVYNPTMLSLKVAFKQPEDPVGDLATGANQAEAVLAMCYTDSLTLASGSSALNSLMLSESALQSVQQAPEGPESEPLDQMKL